MTPSPLVATRPRSGPDLEAQNITVQYGGHVAVDDVTVRAPAGQITGLIGPNGAGKTTFFNACSGVVEPVRGAVSLGDSPLSGLTSAQRAQRGLGRTFQRIELFESMSVLDNIRLGVEARLAGRHAIRLLLSSRAERADIAARADAAVSQCGISALAHLTVQDLSTGQRRLVELARAFATGFSFLLLDEPSSGLDVQETGRVSALLQEVVDQTGIGILIVEHDMALVREVCRYVYVLDFGKLIHAGPTGEVLASDSVRLAYLGADGAA